jgi:hypothetical protein
MKLYRVRASCGCDADTTKETAMQEKIVIDDQGQRHGTMRDKQIFHYRKRDEAHFWHWATTEVIRI